MSRYNEYSDFNRYDVAPYKSTLTSSYHLTNQPKSYLQKTIERNNTQIDILNKIKDNQEVQMSNLNYRPMADISSYPYQSRKKSRSSFQPDRQYLPKTDSKMLNESVLGNSLKEQNYQIDTKKNYYLNVLAPAPRQKSHSRQITTYQINDQKEKKESRVLKMNSYKLHIPIDYQQKQQKNNLQPWSQKQHIFPTVIPKNREQQSANLTPRKLQKTPPANFSDSWHYRGQQRKRITPTKGENINLTPIKRQKTPLVNFRGPRYQRGQQRANLTPTKRENLNLTPTRRENLTPTKRGNLNLTPTKRENANLTPNKHQKTPLVNFSSLWREKGQQSIKLTPTQRAKTPPLLHSIEHHNAKILQRSLQLSDFSMRKPLGQGKFGQVFQAIHKATNSLFALKRVKKETIKTYMMETQFMMEIKMQFFFNHNNILKLYAVFDDSTHIYLVLEYMEEGTLYEKLKKLGQLPEKLASHISTDVLLGVAYLHQNSVAHRDIKPQNIVITCGVCKLCDFGWSAICQGDERRNTVCGTLDYSAPEILEGKQYGKAIDLWCLGVLTYELLVGKAPFYNISRKQTMRKIMNAQNQELVIPNTLSSIARGFINSLIKWDPQQRMEAREALRHAFIKEYAGDD